MSARNNNSIFSRLYRTRIIIDKDGVRIGNISLLFTLIAALTAPWLFLGSVIAALILGYQFRVIRNSTEFSGSFTAVVQEAKDNVRQAVDRFTDK